MKQTRIIWDMPITVDIRSGARQERLIHGVFDYFHHVDEIFSTFKSWSEISRFNRGEIPPENLSTELTEVIRLCEETYQQSYGYFSHIYDGKVQPLGLVKGWAIHKAALFLRQEGVKDFYIDAGGDVEIGGLAEQGVPWSVGIRDPFHREAIVKKLFITDGGVATSGTYIRGSHIYNPKTNRPADADIVSLTVIGPNVYEADRFATAAFAMGKTGIDFIASVPGLEGYQINSRGIATYTRGFDRYTRSYEHTFAY